MNVRDLQYYIYLADSLSFTKTAEQFQVSQPSISIALKRLEDTFETTLIQRNRAVQNIQLTKSGEILYDTAHDILRLLDETKQKISMTKTDAVSIGLLPTMGSSYIPKFMDIFVKFADELVFFEESTSKAIFDKVNKGQLPIAIVVHEQAKILEKWIEQYPIKSYTLSAYMTKNHPLAAKNSLSIKELSTVKLVSLVNDFVHGQLLEIMATESKHTLGKIHQTFDVQTLKTLTQSGVYIGIMSDLLSSDRDKLLKIPIEDAPEIHLSLIVNKEIPLSNSQRDFNQEIIQRVQKEFV